MPITVIYHAGCWDGFCAAWLLHRTYPEANFIPAQYGQEAPKVHGHNLYIVDFSYSRGTLKQLARTNKLVLLDHHKTSERILDGLQEELAAEGIVAHLKFDMTKSGARLTYEYLLARELDEFTRVPWLVEYTEDRDLWLWALPMSRAANAGLRSFPLDFDMWDEFHEDPTMLAHLKEIGVAILRREDQIVQTHVRNARDVLWKNGAWSVTVPVVNATVLHSEIAGALAKGRPFAACYFDRSDGKRQWSLRSDENGLDVSTIASAMGGGGHKHAAGFEGEQKQIDWASVAS